MAMLHATGAMTWVPRPSRLAQVLSRAMQGPFVQAQHTNSMVCDVLS
jgi:hypothetical protein